MWALRTCHPPDRWIIIDLSELLKSVKHLPRHLLKIKKQLSYKTVPDINWHTASAATAAADQKTSSISVWPSPTLSNLYAALALCVLGPQSAEVYGYVWKQDFSISETTTSRQWRRKGYSGQSWWHALTCCQWYWRHRGGSGRSPQLSYDSACFADIQHEHRLPDDPGTLPACFHKNIHIRPILTLKSFLYPTYREKQTFTTPRSKSPSASPATTVCPNPSGGSVGETPPFCGLPAINHIYDTFKMQWSRRKLCYIYDKFNS